jgi:site-specific recombinase XerD
MKAPRKFDQVFLTSGTKGSSEMGQRPLQDSTWNIVARAFKKVGAETSPLQKRGPHAIRHAYATRLLEQNEPIKSIADLLGHKSLETTFIYTKSSIEQLRPLAREWPISESGSV